MREELSKYQAAHARDACHGARLKPEALAVKIAGEDISLSARRSVADAVEWFGSVEDKLTEQQREKCYNEIILSKKKNVKIFKENRLLRIIIKLIFLATILNFI